MSSQMKGASYLAQIFYLDSDSYRPLGVWAESFINMGGGIYGTLDPDKRMVVAIAVPTRAYAAVLLSLGIVVSSIGAGSSRSHIDQLKELVIDTPVFVFREQPDGMCRAKGVYKGWNLKRIGGDEIPYIAIQFDQVGHARHEYPISMWPFIQVAAFPVESMPKRETWHQVTVDDTFVSHVVDYRHAKDLTMRSQLECVILGQVRALHRELVETPFAVQAHDGTFVKGCLQDIVKALRFTSTLGTFRSDVIAVDNSDLDSVTCPTSIPIAILDGSAAYLKWRHLFRSSNRIIVLDRTDRTFDEAVYTLNDEYGLERLAELDSGLGDLPHGVDVMAFWEPVP